LAALGESECLKAGFETPGFSGDWQVVPFVHSLTGFAADTGFAVEQIFGEFPLFQPDLNFS
jgi:hypothetical protein